MDSKKYNEIRRFCYRFLIPKLRDRYLDEACQHVALEYWKGKTNYKWSIINFLRENGIGKKAKLGAMPINNAVFVGSSGEDDQDNCDFLFEKAINKKEEKQDTHDLIFNLLDGLRLKKGIAEWATTIYLQQRLNKSFSILTKLLK